MVSKSSTKMVFLAIVALVCIIPLSKTAQAQLPLEATLDTLDRYQEYSRIYYQIKSIEFSTEIIPLEKFLKRLLDGVNHELSKRRFIDEECLEFMSSQEISQMAMAQSASDKGNYYAWKYEFWKQYQLNEIFLQIDRALRIKKRLFSSGVLVEQQRMFESDLETACAAMGERELTMAIMLFQHMLDFYGYENVDDIIFYQSEAYYDAKQYNETLSGLNRLMIEYPQSEYFEKALYRAVSTYYNLGDYENVHQLYSVFERRGEADWKYKLDVIHFIEGSARFLQHDYEKSHRILAKVDKGSEYYWEAKYLTAQCLNRLDKLEKALEVFEWLLYETNGKNETIFNESTISVGDIFLSQGNWDDGWGYYRLVDEKSPVFARSLIGQAVCHMIREEYEMAIALSDSILNYHWNNRYIYMARCLKARCQQKTGNIGAAELLYSTILEESGRKIGLLEFYAEKLKLIYMLNELRNSEEEALAAGNENLFNQYWNLRNETETMLKRLILSEVKFVDDEFAGFLEERVKIIAILDEYSAISEEIIRIQDWKLAEKYMTFQEDLLKLNAMMIGSGYGHLQNVPHYYKASSEQFSKSTLDSLYRATSEEMNQLEEDLIAASTALVNADAGVSPEERRQMLLTMDNIRSWRRDLDIRISGSSGKLGILEEIDLTRWSHIAFHKTMVPGSDFDDLKAKQKRISDIDEYLQELGNVTYQLGIDVYK